MECCSDPSGTVGRVSDDPESINVFQRERVSRVLKDFCSVSFSRAFSAGDLAADHDLQVSPTVAKTFKVVSWDDSGRPFGMNNHSIS
eukprot:s1267_g37.t1